jgi:hypothetical protein
MLENYCNHWVSSSFYAWLHDLFWTRSNFQCQFNVFQSLKSHLNLTIWRVVLAVVKWIAASRSALRSDCCVLCEVRSVIICETLQVFLLLFYMLSQSAYNSCSTNAIRSVCLLCELMSSFVVLVIILFSGPLVVVSPCPVDMHTTRQSSHPHTHSLTHSNNIVYHTTYNIHCCIVWYCDYSNFTECGRNEMTTRLSFKYRIKTHDNKYNNNHDTTHNIYTQNNH